MSNKEIKEYNVILNNEQVKALVDELKEKDKEVKRLNNILNELEKYIGIKMNSFGVCNASDIYYKLQELKGSDKE